MRAMQIEGDWGLDNIRLAERPDPVPGPGEIVVRMQAASINYRDTVMVNRGYGRRSGELPLVPLSDGAGTVEAVGEGVGRVSLGDLVCPIFGQNWIDGTFREECWGGTLGGPNDGTVQEKMLLPESGVVKAPAHMTAVEAATLPCAAVTAWNAVVEQGKVKGRRRRSGAGNRRRLPVRAAVRQDARRGSGRDLVERRQAGEGAGDGRRSPDQLPRDAEWAKAARAALGRGVDHVVEVGGAGTLEQSLRAVRPGGGVSLIGVLSGVAGNLNLGPVVTQNIRLQGVTVGSRSMFEAMNRAMTLFGTRPAVDDTHRFGFEDVAEALRAFPEGRHFGKVCGVVWGA